MQSHLKISVLFVCRGGYVSCWDMQNDKGLFIIYWEYGTGVSGYGTRTFLMLPSTGHKDFFVFLWYGT